jgi:hypothetical protein
MPPVGGYHQDRRGLRVHVPLLLLASADEVIEQDLNSPPKSESGKETAPALDRTGAVGKVSCVPLGNS